MPADEMLSEWMQGAQLRELVAYPFGRRQRINLFKAHAHKTWAIRTANSRTAWRMRHVRLLDSWAVIGAVGRGRSSSRQLRQVMRSTLPTWGQSRC